MAIGKARIILCANRLLINIALGGGTGVCTGAFAADNFADKLDQVLKEHRLMKMVDADVATAGAQVAVERTAYFPS
jgi:FAD/FMN-containing dehydrogenase